MRRKLLVSVLFLLCFFTSSYSQWKPVKSLRGGQGSAVYKDNDVLYLTVWNFGIVRSIDSGATWNRILNTDYPYLSVNGNLIVTDTMLSTDTGATWQALNMPFNYNIYRALEVYDGKVFCSGYDSIAISSDSGISWIKQKLSDNGGNKFTKSSDNKLFLTTENTLYITNNSGLTWDSICPNPAGSFQLPENIIEKGDTLFYKWGSDIWRTTDHGNNWTVLTNLLNKVREMLFENDTLYLTTHLIPSTPDQVVYSTDLGNTLTVIAQQQLYFAKYFVKTGNLLILPSRGFGALKLDLTNNQLAELSKGIYAIPIYDIIAKHDTIYVSGDLLLYYSFDNGNSWSHAPPYSTYPGNRLAAFDKAVYVLEGFKVLKYDLDSMTWQVLGNGGNYYDEINIDTSGIYCSESSNDNILKFPLQGGGYSIYSTTPSIWHAAINNGNIFGVNDTDVLVSPLLPIPQWTAINTGLPGSIHQGVFAFNNSNVYLGGGKGVYRSQPPAYNWSYTGLFDKGLQELATHGDAVFAATHEKGICVLRNDTSVWDPVNFDLPRGDYDSTHIFAFYSLACSDSGVFTGGTTYPDFGLWYRPYNEFNIPVSTAVVEEEQAFSQFSIYPNPANSSITLSLPSSFNQPIELRIYNTLGEQIYFLKEEITKGKFEKEINVEKWSEGIYFLQVKTKEGNLNRKVVVQH